ncbi:hypothetical protein [Aeromonas phage 32]|nr:hypothetical protein [Aeromonas phage 32]
MQIKHPCDWRNIYARRAFAVCIAPVAYVLLVLSIILDALKENLILEHRSLWSAIKAQWSRNDA